MEKKMKRLIIGSGVLAATVALTETARQMVAGYFVKLALDRKAPPYPAAAERKVTGSDSKQGLLCTANEAGKRLAAKAHETVRIKSSDGVSLTGHWMPVEAPRRIVIAMHGWRSSWERDFGMIADFLWENGCSVLFAEQRGQGSSGGAYMSFGLTERHDCRDWVNWVNEKTDGEYPVYLCGISMGASTVLMAAGLELPRNVCGIVADCGFTSPTAIWKHVAQKRLHLSYRSCGALAGRLAKKKIKVKMDETSCPEALSKTKIPVLFVHGTDDLFVPVEMTYENYKACAGPKHLLVVPGAGHGMSYMVAKEEYEAAVKAFWAGFDKRILS